MKIASDGRLAFWPEPEARRSFEHRLSPGLRREWDSLAAELDPELLAAAALGIAGRLESSDQSEKAAFLLAGLAQSSQLDTELQSKARSRWATLRGEGSFGLQVESLIGRLAREAQRPWPMLAMAGAGACFQVSRLALLARLSGPAANLALPFATVGEAALFTSALPLFEKISPHPGGTAWRGFGTEFLSSLLLMSGLKIGAWPLRFASPAWQFPAIYGGVMLAQAGERRLGLRPEAPLASGWIDGMAMALQIQVGFGITRLALGPGGMLRLAEAEMQSRRPPPAPSGDSPPAIWLSRPAIAAAGLGRTNSAASPIPRHFAMSQHDSDRPRLRLVSADPSVEFMQTYGSNRPFQEAYHRILSHYDGHDATKLKGLLLNSGIQTPNSMIPGLTRLADILCSNSGETARSYRDWLSHRIYERVYFENRNSRALGEVIVALARDEKTTVLEHRLAEHFPELDLRLPRPKSTPGESLNSQISVAQRLYDWKEFERNSELLPLTEQTRVIVYDWKLTQAEKYLGNMQVPIDRFLDDFYELGQGPQAARVSDVNAVIEAAAKSPLGVARLARLQTLIQAGGGDPSVQHLKELL